MSFLLHLVRFDDDIPYFSIELYQYAKEVFERRCFLSFIVGSRGRLRLPQLLITFVALGNAEFVSYLPLFLFFSLGFNGFSHLRRTPSGKIWANFTVLPLSAKASVLKYIFARPLFIFYVGNISVICHSQNMYLQEPINFRDEKDQIQFQNSIKKI